MRRKKRLEKLEALSVGDDLPPVLMIHGGKCWGPGGVETTREEWEARYARQLKNLERLSRPVVTIVEIVEADRNDPE